MMKLIAVWCALSGLLLAPWLLADTVTLKSGEKLEGKVTSDTPPEISIDVRVSASITDSRTVPRAEIASVEKTTPEELAWQSLQALKPGDSSQPAAAYEVAIGSLQSFVDKFPQSPHAASAGQSLADFAEEKRRVDGGDIKIGGKWLTREEVARERYQISGQLLFARMQDLARRGDVSAALNEYDALEKNFPGARVFPDAVELAQKLIQNLNAAADRTLLTWKTRKIERVEGLKLVSEPQRSELAAAQAHEEKASDATVEAAQKGGPKWPPLQAIGEKNATYLSGRATTELKRLEALPIAKMRQSLQQTDTALELLVKHDDAVALESFRAATTLWPANEIAARETKSLSERAKATPSPPVPVAPAATPAATPVATPAVARATPPPSVPLQTLPPEPESSGLGPVVYGGIAVVLLGLVFLATRLLKKKKDEPDPPA